MGKRISGIHAKSAYSEFPDLSDAENGKADIAFELSGKANLCIQAFYDGKEVGSATISGAAGNIFASLPLLRETSLGMRKRETFITLYSHSEKMWYSVISD